MTDAISRRSPPRPGIVLSLLASLSALVLALSESAMAAPTLAVTEHAMEMSVISYRVNAAGRGTATVTGCRQCDDSIRFAITGSTRLFAGDTEVRFADIPNVERQRATLYYDPVTMRLNRIILRGRSPGY